MEMMMTTQTPKESEDNENPGKFRSSLLAGLRDVARSRVTRMNEVYSTLLYQSLLVLLLGFTGLLIYNCFAEAKNLDDVIDIIKRNAEVDPCSLPARAAPSGLVNQRSLQLACRRKHRYRFTRTSKPP